MHYLQSRVFDSRERAPRPKCWRFAAQQEKSNDGLKIGALPDLVTPSLLCSRHGV